MSCLVYKIYLILLNSLLIYSCDEGYLEIGGICVKCVKNCSICQAACNTCLEGFYRTWDYKCSACSNGCRVCSSSSSCSQCYPKYYKSGSSCQACPTQCATCDSYTVCQTCEENYFINNNACKTCDSSCKTCSGSSNTCTSCIDGKYLYDYQCLTCAFPCQTCISNSNFCMTCQDINQHAVDFKCVCNDGYYDNGQNQCKDCKPPCLKCENEAFKCTECINPFILSQSTQYKCNCSSGYFQLDSQTCKKCKIPCKTCENYEDHCLSCIENNQELNELNHCICKTGWILHTDGVTCIQCQLPCLDCVQTINKCKTCQDSSLQQPDSCQCQAGWLQDNNYFCIPCLKPCQTCELTTSKCLTCLDVNHELNSQSQCVCKSNYYSDSLTTCAKCDEKCHECDSNGCLGCVDVNQILDSNHQCICKNGYISQGIYCLQCQKPCSTCINSVNQCLTCQDIYQTVKYYQCICNEGYILNGDFCCDKSCINCQGSNQCSACMKGFYLSSNSRCLQCIENCIICENSINCQTCQDGYFIDQQTQCKECTSNCKSCGDSIRCDVCFDGYYLFDLKCHICDQNCLTCNAQPENCITCRQNYEITENNQCVCKNGYYELQNQCYRCQYPCKLCSSQMKCQECFVLPNLNLDEEFQCKCSSGYFWNQTNCFKCYQSCLTCTSNQFNCLSCDHNQHRILLNNQCTCASNYFENENGVCISCLDDLGKSQESCKFKDCNDSIWTYGEECDDGNDVVRDGCSDCKTDQNYSCHNEILKQSICFQCIPNCSKCELNPLTKQSQCIKCQVGYFLDNYDCIECSVNCLECIDQAYNYVSCKFLAEKNGKCQNCNTDQGYYIDESNRLCITKCGDYIKANEEECDDGNLIKGDGCDDQCKLEKLYIFVNGVSIIPTYPKPSLQSVGNSQIYSNFRLFKLSYNTHIFIKDDFQIQDYLSFHVQKQNDTQQLDQEYQLTQEVSQINEYNQSQLNLMINITFSRSSQDEILLIKFLNTSLIYQNEGYSQVEKEVSCSIPKFIYIDDAVVTQVQITTQSNAYVLYFIGAMCGASVLFGGVEVFFNLLDTLQMLSYFKYINLQLPYNLQKYFQFFGFAQFNFIQKIFDLSGFINLILDTRHLKKIPSKLAGDDLTSLFLINASTIITVWISLFIIYGIAKLIPRLLYAIKFKFYSDNQTQNQFIVQIGVYYLAIKYFINKLCYAVISEFFYSGILRAHMTTAYDFTFSVVLQLYALELFSSNFFINLSSFLACIASAAYIFSIYVVIRLLQIKKYSINNQVIKTKYGSVFEGITIKRFSKYYNAILLIKKLIFMVLLIFTYEFPTFQICSITFLSISMSLFIIVFSPLKDKIEYFKQLFSEVSISLTLLSLTFLNCGLDLGYFQYEAQQKIGWCCIFLMTSILCVQLGIDSFQQWRFLYRKYKQIRRLAQSIFGVFKGKNQNTASANIFQ